MQRLVELIKKGALEAVESTNPSALLFGSVESINPLKINVEQKMTIGDAHLILSTLVQDFDVEMTVNHKTDNDSNLNTTHSHPGASESSFDSTHHHGYTGKKKFTVHLGLKQGEKVILLRMQGGQKYMVLDRQR